MTHPKTIFVSDDARLRDGKLDPVDKEVMRAAGSGGKVFMMTSAEAMAMVEADTTPRRRSALDRELADLTPPPAENRPGLHQLSPSDVHDLVGASAATWQHFRQEAAAAMTDERAAYVRKLRVDRKYTWRSVARACSGAWRQDWGSNQIAGMAVCEAAAERFFENYREPPWN
ncbi:MAG: hypothetical protein ACRDI2_11465 [Chloroflexota bacterium]